MACALYRLYEGWRVHYTGYMKDGVCTIPVIWRMACRQSRTVLSGAGVQSRGLIQSIRKQTSWSQICPKWEGRHWKSENRVQKLNNNNDSSSCLTVSLLFYSLLSTVFFPVYTLDSALSFSPWSLESADFRHPRPWFRTLYNNNCKVVFTPLSALIHFPDLHKQVVHLISALSLPSPGPGP